MLPKKPPTRKKTRTYLVWETEYPDEGSFEVKANSPARAKAKYRTLTNGANVELGSCLLTPKLRRERTNRAKAEAKGLECGVCRETARHCRCATFVTPTKTS